MTLEELRKRLSEVDRELLGLVAARQRIVAEIGTHKIRNGFYATIQILQDSSP